MKSLIPILSFFIFLSPAYGQTPTAQLDNNNENILLSSGQKQFKIPIKKIKGLDEYGEPNVFQSGDLTIIQLEHTDAESATTMAYATNPSGQLLWTLDLGGFNPSTPLIEKDFVYLAALGKVFKVNAQTGKVVWKHEGLYQNKSYQFNGSSTITREKAMIQFSNVVRVSDSNGKLEVARK
jgi:outer membrane protein assembly factor BamB